MRPEKTVGPGSPTLIEYCLNEELVIFIDISIMVVLVTGVALCGLALWGIFAPAKLLQWVKNTIAANWGFWFAVMVRLVLGVALLVAAPASRFPSAFLIIGWIAIGAAIAVAVMGTERLRKFVDWWLEKFSPTLIRVWLLFALAFGGFLIYGAL